MDMSGIFLDMLMDIHGYFHGLSMDMNGFYNGFIDIYMVVNVYAWNDKNLQWIINHLLRGTHTCIYGMSMLYTDNRCDDILAI